MDLGRLEPNVHTFHGLAGQCHSFSPLACQDAFLYVTRGTVVYTRRQPLVGLSSSATAIALTLWADKFELFRSGATQFGTFPKCAACNFASSTFLLEP